VVLTEANVMELGQACHIQEQAPTSRERNVVCVVVSGGAGGGGGAGVWGGRGKGNVGGREGQPIGGVGWGGSRCACPVPE